jgi:hypothetical protein
MEGKIRNLDPDPYFPAVEEDATMKWKVKYGIWTLTPILPDPDFGIWTLTPISRPMKWKVKYGIWTLTTISRLWKKTQR